MVLINFSDRKVAFNFFSSVGMHYKIFINHLITPIMKRFDVMCSGKQMMSSATSQEKQVVAKIMELLKE